MDYILVYMESLQTVACMVVYPAVYCKQMVSFARLLKNLYQLSINNAT